MDPNLQNIITFPNDNHGHSSPDEFKPNYFGVVFSILLLIVGIIAMIGPRINKK